MREETGSVTRAATALEVIHASKVVQAYRAGSHHLLVMWAEQHRTLLVCLALILATALITGGVLWRQHVRSLTDWGEPVLVEDFATGSWRERWREVELWTFRTHNGELLTTGPHSNLILLKRPLSGAVAIEYDGRYLPDAQAGDLSVIWTEAPDALSNTVELTGQAKHRGYWLQAGAYDNHFCAIYGRPLMSRLDKAALRLDPKQTHHFRVELDGRRLRMLIDGKQVTEFEDLLPIGTGRIGFYGYYPGKVFSKVRVYQRKVAELQPATSAGDAFLEQKLYDQASVAYQRVTESLPGTALAEEARYRQGLALRLGGQAEASSAAWAELKAPELLARVALHRLDDRFRAGDRVAACDGLTSLHLANPSLRFLSRSTWQSWADLAFQSALQPAVCEALTRTKEQAFPDDQGSNQEYAELLMRSGRHAEVPTRVPGEILTYTWAMVRLGRTDELASKLNDFPFATFNIDLANGNFPTDWPHRWSEDEVLCWRGRAAEALSKHPTADRPHVWLTPPEEILAKDPSPALRLAALAALGRWDEALAVPETPATQNLLGLTRLLSGRYEPSLLDAYPSPELHGCGMIDAAAAGNAELLGRMRAEVKRLWPDWDRWFVWMAIEPCVLPPEERVSLLRSRLELTWASGRNKQAQRAWYVAGLALGHHDEAAMAKMPTSAEAAMWTAVGQALRAELAGDEAGVKTAWTTYSALPSRQRLSMYMVPTPSLERLAAFKLSGK